MSDIESILCDAHGTWYPRLITDGSGINGTCECDAFWSATYCTDLTASMFYPFHYAFMAIWTIIGIVSGWYTWHVSSAILIARRHRALQHASIFMQLGACICAICTCISGIVSSLTFITDSYPGLENTDLTIPALFMITSAILTFRRLITAAARMHAPTRLFISRADKGAIVFTIILTILSIMDKIIDTVSIYWNIIGALYGLCILPSIVRAIRLLQTLLPTTRSAVSRALIERNIWLLKAAFVHALSLVILIGSISAVGRTAESIIQWNVLYMLETVFIMGLTIEVIIIMGHIHEHTKVLNPGAVTTFVVSSPSPLGPTKSFHSLHRHPSTSPNGQQQQQQHGQPSVHTRAFSTHSLPAVQPGLSPVTSGHSHHKLYASSSPNEPST